MSDVITADAPATVEAPKTPAKANKPAKAKAAKKAAKPAKAKPSANGHPSTLTKPQVRLLRALSTAKRPMSREQLAKAGKVADTWVSGFVAKACAANRTPSLVEQRFARPIEVDVDGRKERLFEITATGRKALAKAE